MRGAKIGFGLFFLGFGGLFAVIFHERYWRWRDCFNDLGRYFDPVSEQVYVEHAGLIWGSLMGVSLAAGLLLLWWGLGRRW